MGKLSPLDGIGPEDLAIQSLVSLCEAKKFSEIIFAINPTVEGEATIFYLMEILKHLDASFSQLARGIPLGGTLEFSDPATIDKSIVSRSRLATEDN